MSMSERQGDAQETSHLWIRLPGLFSWSEVCMLFSNEAGPDKDWHFSVKMESIGADQQPLYVVRAALRGSSEAAGAWSESRDGKPRRSLRGS